MPTTKSTNSQEAAAAFDPNRFFGHTPEQRWYAQRGSKRTAQSSRRETELDQALSNAYQQYPIEEVAQPAERKLTEEEVIELIGRVQQTGHVLAWYRLEEVGD